MTKMEQIRAIEQIATLDTRVQSPERHWEPRIFLALLVIVAITLALRLPLIGDPFFHIDEQFYLLVGDRMLHGALPYVDIWDRKPIGLFLLFAGFRLLPGDGIVAYQVASTIAVVLTATVIARIVQRFAGALPAACGGVIYALMCEFLGGGGGQSPVFYNLPVAFAALLVLRCIERSGSRQSVRDGGLAMLLMGIAIQIKYTVAIEGAYLGCVLLWSFHRAGAPFGRIALAALLFASLGVGPTLLAAAYYLYTGHFAAFWYANFVSIVQRGPLPHGMAAANLFYDAMIVLPTMPLLARAVIRIARMHDVTARAQGIVMLGWLAAAIVGFFSIGSYFNHYALPILAPLAVLCAIGCRGSIVAPIYVGLFLTTYFVHFEPTAIERRDVHAALANHMVSASTPYANSCMQVLTGQPILLLLTHACTKTPYVFPTHLIIASEQHALGVEQMSAVRSLIAADVGVIVAAPKTGPGVRQENMAVLDAELAAHYRPIFRVPAEPDISDDHPIFIFVRRNLLHQP